MSTSRLSIAITVMALSLGPWLTSAGQDAQSPSARLTYTEGSVEVNNQNVTSEMRLAESDVLLTGDDGVAEVAFPGVAILRLAPDTQVDVSRLARLASGEALTRVDFDGGEMEVEILGQAPGDFAVSARNKNIRITGSGRFRFFSAADYPLEVAVWSGEATIHDQKSGRDVAVERGETFTLAPNDQEKYDLEKGIEADDLDKFSGMRDQYLAGGNATEAENTVPASIPDSGPDFVDPCQPPYPDVVPPECFNSAALAFYVPVYAYPAVGGIVSYHRHPRHLPFLHPPTAPVAAAANKPPADPPRLAGPTRRPRIVLDDENFKRTVPPNDEKKTDEKQTEGKSVTAAGTEPSTENPNTQNEARRPVRVIGNGFTESRDVRASRPSEPAHSTQETSTYSRASAPAAAPSYSVSHSSGGSGVSVESHSAPAASSNSSSSSSSSSGRGK